MEYRNFGSSDLRVSAMRGAPEGAPDLTEVSDERAWYVVHCYSGYENKVRHNLEQRIETMGMKDRVFDVVVPTQEEIEVREGKRRPPRSAPKKWPRSSSAWKRMRPWSRSRSRLGNASASWMGLSTTSAAWSRISIWNVPKYA